jgi:hypothetical protein
LLDYWWPEDGYWPAEVGQAVVFRFGYFNCFTSDHLAQFARWEQSGATLLNPTTFYLESKLLLAALQLPAVRERLTAATLAILAACLPESYPLTTATLPRLLDSQDNWIVKFAGYDDGGQDWGGRSLQLGRAHSRATWEAVLRRYLALPFPVIAQPYLPSQRIDIPYWTLDGKQQVMNNGNTRLRSFLLRQEEGPNAYGTHLTVSQDQLMVAEATDAVQTPLLFRG